VAALRFALACSGNGDSEVGPPVTLPERDGEDPEGDAPDASTRPSFCDGLVLYASLDTGFSAELGVSDPLPYGTTTLTPLGRFGGGAELSVDGGGGGDAAAALYYVQRDGGPAVFPEQQGTVSLWFRGNINAAVPVLYRPTANVLPAQVVPAGLALVGFGGEFGLVNVTPTGGQQNVHVFPKSQVNPFLRTGDFNHYATSWRRGDAGGQPTAAMVLNGGLGEIFDASADAPSYADAMPTDAGALRVPYRGYSSATWNHDASAIALRLGGPGPNAPQGEIDDIAVWDRVLSFDEMADVYRAGAAIKTACGL
jgi:hypothetical protein